VGCEFCAVVYLLSNKIATQQVNAAIALNTGIARDAHVFPRFWKDLPLTSVIKPVPPVLAQDDPVSSLPDDLVLQHFIRGMLAMDVNERLSLQACLNHQFFASETVETPGFGGLNLPECPSMLRFRTIWNGTGT
jgi:serine/threonine protein kinase